MAGEIRKEQIIHAAEINEAIQSVADKVGGLVEIMKSVGKYSINAKSIIKAANSTKDLSGALDQTTKNTKKLSVAEQQLVTIQKQIDALLARQTEEYKQLNKEKQQLLTSLKKENDELRESITGNKAAAKAAKEKAAADKQNAAIIKERIKYEQISGDLVKKLTAANKIHAETMKGVNVLTEEGRARYAKLNSIIEANKKQIQGITAAKKAEAQALKGQQKKEEADRRAAAKATKEQEKAIRLKIAAQQAEKGSVQQLQAVNAILQNRMRGLNTLIPKQRAEYERLSRAVNNNKNKIRELNSAHQGQMKSAGGFKGMLGGLIKSVGAYAAAIFGLNRLISFFTRDLLEMTKKLDSLDYSMGIVISNQKELAATQEFLSDTAQNYGQDILTLSARYIKFRAATQQSNMSMRDTMRIFDSTAKAAAVLGLKTDEVNGVFLALEQMVSKGKVTTEELRRQLGERLPGAMGIMADAMGVTIVQLDKMLKAGSVLSSEALPKFAVALEKAYGIEAVNKVDNLAAAHGRLRTSWVELVDTINASKLYTKAINSITSAITRLKYVIGGTSSLKKDTEAYFDMLNDGVTRFGNAVRRIGAVRLFAPLFERDARAFRDLIEEMELAEKQGAAKSKEYFMDRLDTIGFSLDKAEALWKEYYRRIGGMQEDEPDNLMTFDFEEYKKSLDEAETITELYAKLSSDELKKFVASGNEYTKWGKTSYEEILEAQVNALKKRREAAQKESDKWEEMARKQKDSAEEFAKGNVTSSWDIEGLTPAEQKKREQAGMNVIAITNAQIELEKRLYDLRNKDKDKKENDPLKLMRERHKQELEETRKHQEELILQNDFTEDELLRIRYDNNKELLMQEKEQLEEQLGLAKGNVIEETKIRTDLAGIDAEIAKSITDFRIDEEERWLKEKERLAKEEERKAKEKSGIAYDTLYDNVTVAQTDEINTAAKEVEANKSNAAKIVQIKNQLAVKLLEIEMEMVQAAIDGNEIIGEDEERLKNRILDIQKAIAEGNLNIAEDSGKTTKESVSKAIDAAAQIAGQSFDIIGNIYDAQMQKIQQLHDFEIAAAGDSVEKRIMAERKYEKEKSKILKKQAAAQKAQAAFGIIINTAMAIMATMGQAGFFGTPLAIIVAALGAAQLATVLATPIPEFAEGTTDAPETFIAGEEGQELIVKRSGEKVLTPNKPTLFSDKSFIGSTILPHDETQRMLANYAVTQSYDIVDMSDTNKYLRNIVENTRRKREIVQRNGKTVMIRGYIKSTLC